jgi:large subunit ribosomal protein L1
MAKLTKRKQLFRDKVDSARLYPITEALTLLKEMATAKFPEAVDVAINLGVDPRKSDQVVRSSTVLPNGTGKTVRVAVFAQGTNADAAQQAGADLVGFEELAETIKSGQMDFDILIATPDAMRLVGQLGRILGPRGLMPNPKTGTVTTDVAAAVANAKAGQVSYRTDKGGIIHCTIGKANFPPEHLQQNLQALLTDLQKVKPSTSKGVYMRRVTLSTTMGPGVAVDMSTLSY